jgi:hypothetical protein
LCLASAWVRQRVLDEEQRVVAAFVVTVVPVGQTNVAEFVVAATDHVVAPFTALDEEVAFWTALPVPEVLLEIGFAGALVLGQLALAAEADPALGALEDAAGGVHDALAVGGGAQSEVGVADGLLPERVPPVPILGLLWESIVDASFCVHHPRAALFRACDFSHDVDLVHAVGVETVDAEAMLTVADTVHITVGMGFFAEFAFAANDGTVPNEIRQRDAIVFFIAHAKE